MEFNEAYDPFRALQTSWRAIKQAPLPLIIGGVVLMITGGGGGGGGNFGSSFDGQRDVDWDVVACGIAPGRSASECGRLRHGDGAHARRRPPSEGANVGFALAGVHVRSIRV